jgi:ParB family chromosome partitioning protein
LEEILLMAKKRGLGRGLSSLIPPSDAADVKESGLLYVLIEAISPNPHQPRSGIDEGKLAELALSIGEHGLIQPLIVTQVTEGQYTLIAGERRWRAASLAGLSRVPVLVIEATSQDMLELAVVENVQRDDLNALEEALAYHHLIADFGLTQEEVAVRVGKSRPTVANLLRLLNLPGNVQAAVVEGRISGAHARALLPLETPEAQTEVMNIIVNRDLSVRQVEALVKKRLEGQKPKPKPAPSRPPELIELESMFRQSLGTKVNIQGGEKGGKVIIHYYSDEELQAIYEAIVDSS